MARKCAFSGKMRQTGCRVSHANNRTKHSFKANVQTKRILIPSLNKTVKVTLSTQMLRTIDKIGIDAAMKKFGVRVGDIGF